MKNTIPYEARSFLFNAMQKTAHMSDYFVCVNCGHGAHIKVLGDTATCSQCGGTMKRSGT